MINGVGSARMSGAEGPGALPEIVCGPSGAGPETVRGAPWGRPGAVLGRFPGHRVGVTITLAGCLNYASP